MKRNWRRKYRKETEAQNTNSLESIEEEEVPVQQPQVSTATQQHRSRFSIWLSIVCYSFALTILLAVFAEWATDRISSSLNFGQQTPVVNNNTYYEINEEAYTEFDGASTTATPVEEILETALAQPESSEDFQYQLQALYLVILGAVAGYLQVIQHYRS
jgi:hypothetical protein